MSEIGSIVSALQLESRDDVRSVLKKFWWVESISEYPLSVLCNEILSMRQEWTGENDGTEKANFETLDTMNRHSRGHSTTLFYS